MQRFFTAKHTRVNDTQVFLVEEWDFSEGQVNYKEVIIMASCMSRTIGSLNEGN